MAEKRYYFLQIKDDLFNSRRIKKMLKLDNGYTLFVVYLKLQLLAMKHDGNLIYSGLEATLAEDLALDIDEQPEDVEACIDFLLKTELAEQITDETIFLPWSVRNSRSEGTSAGRMRNKRERDKEDASHCDGSSEQSDANEEQSYDNYNYNQIHNEKLKTEDMAGKKKIIPRYYENDSFFDKLWDVYPKKSGDIREAFSEYMRATDNGADPAEMLKAIRDLDTSEGTQYLPSMGKWLRNRGWITKQPSATGSKMEELRLREAETLACLEKDGASWKPC